jgi:pimeloyl-ACP methyl ester carboxylesterase
MMNGPTESLTLPDGAPVTSGLVQAGEISLHVVEAGPADGPAVLLLHGFPEFWWGWRHQIGPLAAAGFRVIVPDGRGYNLSDKPAGVDAYRLDRLGGDVLRLADALGLERFGLVGHDWGGIVAWWAAARHPDRIRRLAILNAPHPDTALGVARADPKQLLRSWYIGLFQLPGLSEALLAARDYRALSELVARNARRGSVTADDLARYREAWSQPGALTGSLNWYRALVRRPAGRAGRVRVPTLILWGQRDAALSPLFPDASARLCDEAEIRRFERATHWVQHEEPEAVNAALIEHLRR